MPSDILNALTALDIEMYLDSIPHNTVLSVDAHGSNSGKEVTSSVAGGRLSSGDVEPYRDVTMELKQ